MLAVSGGLDSMCLLHAVATRRRPGQSVVVATFDHRSSPVSAAAVRHVRREGAARGLEVVAARAAVRERSEAGWRRARWAFLRSAAATRGATILTAHTADDHLETVVMRVLRGTGARGLAALLAPAPGIERPFVGIPRESLHAWAERDGLSWVEDPTNLDPRWFRNRVRHELLPALMRVDPTLPRVLVDLSIRAAAWRAEMAGLVAGWARADAPGAVLVDADRLADLDPPGRLVAWQAILGEQGRALDRRGLRRLAVMAPRGRTGLTVPLSGGVEAVVVREGIRVSARPDVPPLVRGVEGRDSVAFGSWVFRWALAAETSDGTGVSDERGTWVRDGAEVTVRAWEPGDRLAGGATRPSRRVSRFLADAGIAGPLRRGWPVVLADGEIVWVPGIRRANAAPVRPGRPVRRLECERSRP